MQLDLKQIKDITCGAVEVMRQQDGFHFYRFTAPQRELYEREKSHANVRVFSTSGIALNFITDSRHLTLKVTVEPGSSRKYFAFDVFVNGNSAGSLNNFGDEDLIGEYCGVDLPLGRFEKTFELGSGEKQVRIYFPWSVKAVVREITLDDGAYAVPIRPKYKLLSFGDSITQGYDALHPSNKYITKIAQALDAEEFNKGIGGEIFFPELAGIKENFTPDYITVAYGTNDWNGCTKQQFMQNCSAFFKNIHENYPNSRVFAITPIWRKSHNDKKAFDSFGEIGEIIGNITDKYENMTAICGYDFVPHDEKLFADLCLHPNDTGFNYYFENLLKHLK